MIVLLTMNQTETTYAAAGLRKTRWYLFIMSSVVTLPLVGFIVYEFILSRRDDPFTYLDQFKSNIATNILTLALPVIVIYIADYVAKKTRSGILTFFASVLSFPILLFLLSFFLGRIGLGINGFGPLLVAIPQLFVISIFSIIITALNAPLKVP